MGENCCSGDCSSKNCGKQDDHFDDVEVGGVGHGGHACSGNLPHEHSHHGHHHGHHHESPPVASMPVTSVEHHDSAICLAVVREDGTDIVVFDASGRPKSFTYKGDIRKLCFNTHGVAGDLLTPCFDEDGNHGTPEEGCFCGVETPHLHAHLRNPETCETAGNASSCDAKSIGSLASHILHPKDDIEEGDEKQGTPVLKFGVSEVMPNECNAKDLIMHMNSKGVKQQTREKRLRRVHQVQHEDHVDYLVHDASTGDLHLSHPCDDCGADDVHGKFRSVGKRSLSRKGDNLQVHFFEVSKRPFNILDHFHDLFEINSDRVAAVDRILETPGRKLTRRGSKRTKVTGSFLPFDLLEAPSKEDGKTVRSTLSCNAICCSAEVPMITKIMDPLQGVEKVLINVPLRQVIVDHDPQVITASEIKRILDKNEFGAEIKVDGGRSMKKGGVGRSQFFVQGICCASEIPAINKIVEPIDGVSAISINVTTKTVYVDHDVSVVAAQHIADALNNEGFGAAIRHDAGKSSARETFVTSVLAFQEIDPGTAELTAFLRTFDANQLESFVVDVPSRTITISHNPFSLTASAIASALREKTQLHATVSSDGADPSLWNFDADSEIDEQEIEKDGFTLPKLNVILSGLFWIISMLHYVGGNWEHLQYVSIASIVFGIPPIAIKAFKTLRRYQFDTNCLMFFASCGAIALQEFEEAGAVVFLFALSEWLEVRATSRARRAMSAIVNLRPEKANLVHPVTHDIIVTRATRVPVGALVCVKTGDKVPCDGIVVEGSSTVDESSLTGESRPIRKVPGDNVSGGTVNSGMTQLMVRTTSTSDDSAVSRLIRLVEEAQANRSETEKMVDEFAKVYTPVVVVAALLMCTIPWAFGNQAGVEWTRNGLVLIVVACPCALIISTPVSYVAGLAATAQRGVLIKGGANLEALGLVKKVCFDKTGTLTNGDFALLEFKVLTTNMTRVQVLQHLALMEERASHPVAQAIITGARNEGVSIPKDLELGSHTIIPGEGVEGLINGRLVHVGNERLFQRLGYVTSLPDEVTSEVSGWKALGGTVGYMSIEGEGIVCAYSAADGVRQESAAVVSNLRRLGIDVMMLTGDNQDAAHAIGRQVGLSEQEVKSKLLPEDKLNYVRGLSMRGELSVLRNLRGRRELVMMCGDGVNDAPALASADIGVAMGAGAALAMETADVTLLDSNLEKLEYSIRMGRRVLWKIRQNVIFSVVVKFVVLGLALAGISHLWAAIASDVGAMIIVTLNAMLLLPKRLKDSDISALKGDIEHGPAMASRQPTTSVKALNNTCNGNSCSSKSCCEGAKEGVGVPPKTQCSSSISCCSEKKTAGCTKQSCGTMGHDCAAESCGESKGCCDKEKKKDAASAHSHSHSHAHGLAKEDVSAESCCKSKGCCDKEKKKDAASAHSHSHSHAHGLTKEDVSPEACCKSKGCCDSAPNLHHQ